MVTGDLAGDLTGECETDVDCGEVVGAFFVGEPDSFSGDFEGEPALEFGDLTDSFSESILFDNSFSGCFGLVFLTGDIGFSSIAGFTGDLFPLVVSSAVFGVSLRFGDLDIFEDGDFLSAVLAVFGDGSESTSPFVLLLLFLFEEIGPSSTDLLAKVDSECSLSLLIKSCFKPCVDNPASDNFAFSSTTFVIDDINEHATNARR